MDGPDNEYLLGSDPEELERLRFQDEVWAAETESLIARAGFTAGAHILDLGAGPGLTTQRLAKAVTPGGRVTAIERSQRFVQVIESTGREDITALHCEVQEIPLDDASVDGAFARWLLCFIGDPTPVVREVARVIRPGGRFAVMDYYNYLGIALQPPSRRFKRTFEAVYQSFKNHGGDLDVGGKLPSVLQQSGFELCDLIPIHRAARPGSGPWRWVTQFQTLYLPQVLDEGLISRQELDEFRKEWAKQTPESGAFFCTPPMIGIVAVRK